MTAPAIVIACYDPNYTALYVNDVFKDEGSHEDFHAGSVVRALSAASVPFSLYEMNEEMYDDYVNGAGMPETTPSWLSDCRRIR